jgi:hypothetical protein
MNRVPLVAEIFNPVRLTRFFIEFNQAILTTLLVYISYVDLYYMHEFNVIDYIIMV